MDVLKYELNLLRYLSDLNRDIFYNCTPAEIFAGILARNESSDYFGESGLRQGKIWIRWSKNPRLLDEIWKRGPKAILKCINGGLRHASGLWVGANGKHTRYSLSIDTFAFTVLPSLGIIAGVAMRFEPDGGATIAAPPRTCESVVIDSVLRIMASTKEECRRQAHWYANKSVDECWYENLARKD